MDTAARDALTTALDAATAELGQAHTATGRAIEFATNAQHRAAAVGTKRSPGSCRW